MKIKLREVLEAAGSFQVLQNKEVPIKVAYRLKRLANKLQSDINLYSENRNELIKKLGEKQKDGTFKVVDPEKLEELSNQTKELLNEEIEVEFNKIKLSELGDIKIEPNSLIEWVFEE